MIRLKREDERPLFLIQPTYQFILIELLMFKVVCNFKISGVKE